jgi:ATP phosphoribosyltransferase
VNGAVADGDVTESGLTMRSAGLKAIATVETTSAYLIKSKHPSDPALADIITNRIRGVIASQKYVLCTYNVERRLLDEAKKITPGNRSPTVTNLAEEGWCAVQAMVERDKAADAMDALKALGALDIFTTALDNARP